MMMMIHCKLITPLGVFRLLERGWNRHRPRWRSSRYSHRLCWRQRHRSPRGAVRQTAVPLLKVVGKLCIFPYHFSGIIWHTSGTLNVIYDNKHKH